MATIGTFETTKTGYAGRIATLALTTDAEFVANKKKRNGNSPDFFVKAGNCDLGVAWKTKARGEDGRDYLRVVLDDPSLPLPIEAALFDRKGGADLVWSRRVESEA